MFQKYKDNDKLKMLVSILLCHIIDADDVKSEKEMNKFHEIFESQFQISKDESMVIYQETVKLNFDLISDIEKIEKELASDTIRKAKVMKILNEMILSDGIDNREYEVFEIIRNKLF